MTVCRHGNIEPRTFAQSRTFVDFQLHAEFRVPAVNPPHTNNAITNSEQAMGNSGIYMQGRYEVSDFRFVRSSAQRNLLNDEGRLQREDPLSNERIAACGNLADV